MNKSAGKLYFAITGFSPHVTEYLLSLQSIRNDRKIRWQTAEGLHATVLMLGECNPYNIKNAVNALQQIVHPKFTMYVNGMNKFTTKKEYILYAQLAGNKLLSDINRKSVTKSSEHFNIPNRRFNPHITVGRIPLYKTKDLDNHIVQTSKARIRIDVTEIVLIHSYFNKGVSKHEVIARQPLL
jgi:2'-5' RNA ligase